MSKITQLSGRTKQDSNSRNVILEPTPLVILSVPNDFHIKGILTPQFSLITGTAPPSPLPYLSLPWHYEL